LASPTGACADKLLADYKKEKAKAALVGVEVAHLVYEIGNGGGPAGVIALVISAALEEAVAKRYCRTCYCLKSADPQLH
jgi:hypothetical protein